MAVSLLAKWLAHYDPIHGGWTPMGIAAGRPALAGHGWFGGQRVLLFTGTSRAAIDTTYPVGVADADASSIAVRAGVELAVGTHYFQAIPYGPGGVAAVPDTTRPQIVAVVVGAGGPDPLRPSAPRGLAATAIAAGGIRLTWSFVASAGKPATAAFAIYGDGGTGTVDYDTPLDTVSARLSPGGLYNWSDTFSDGTTYKFAVRALSADGTDDGNTTEVSATADAGEPTAGEISALTLGDDA